MYLKSLTLKGFKSFADRTVMKFEPGVAAIVGPNGSGKSNISDAVLWVLGERNAKNLRGQAMEDVIFAGARNRKSVNVAEVELCLDNSDGTLPVEYSEVSIGRRMYRNGESEYLINGAVVRRMDVLDILHDSGLGTGTNSIISQGNLDSVLSSKPEDRRALIEEAAGILKHKERKRRSLRKLERMENNLARVQDIAREVERQLKPLERKAKRAQTYAQLSAELSELKLDLAIDDLRALRERWSSIEKQEAELDQKALVAKEVLDSSQTNLEELQKQLEERDVQSASLNQNHARAQRTAERLSSQVMVLKERRSHIRSELERVSRELEQSSQRKKGLEAEVASAKEAFDKAAAEQNAAKEKLSSISKEHDERRIERNGLRKRIDALTTEQRSLATRLDTVKAAQEALKNELSEAEATASVLAARKADLDERIAAKAAEAKERRAEATSLAADLSAKQEAEAEVRSKMGQALVSRNKLREECDSARDSLTKISAERAALEEQERAGERTNPMLAWLLDDSSESYAPVSKGLVVPAELESVVELLLGIDIHALRVEGDMQQALESLASHEVAGQAVLLPSSAQADVPEAGAARLIDELKVSPEFTGALSALLGDVLLAGTLKEGFALVRESQARVATRDGFVLWPNGKVSFARPAATDKAQGSLARRRRIVLLAEQEEKASALYSSLNERSAKAEEDLRVYQAQTLTLSEELAQVRGSASSASDAAEAAEAALSALNEELSELESRIAKNQTALTDARPRTDTLASQSVELSESLKKNKAEIAELETRVSPLQKQVLELSQRLSDARLDLARLGERAAYAERMLQTRQSEVKDLLRRNDEGQGLISTTKLASKRIDPLLSVLGRLADSAGVLVIKLEEKSAAEQSASSGLSGKVASATQAMRQAHDSYDALNAQISELRIEKGRLEVRVDGAAKTITDEHGISLETALKREPLASREDASAGAESLERRIKNLGTINPDAAKEFEEISKRHDYLSGQLADMRAARSSLVRITNVIDERMRDDFLNTFNQVNDNFAQIFATLFPGGQAHLSLVDPDDLENTGVDVNAQPVGKRVRKMSLLSGGEKSMTAMALLFAVYGIRRTPFYILDEVEAALDDTNLRRLIAYLQRVRKDTQLIMITHQRRTMESADILYGVSMQADGITKVISQKLEAAIAASKEG